MEERMKTAIVRIGVLLAGIVLGGGFMLMVYFMSQMNANMGAMTASIGGIYEDIHEMHDHVAIMAGEVSKLVYVVAHMDENMNAMNNQVTLIQRSISDDLSQMNRSVESIANALFFMDSKVGNISIDVNRMSNMISGVTYDVHRGTQSFTSPMGYMLNMMP